MLQLLKEQKEAEAIANKATELNTKIHHQGVQNQNIHVKAKETEKNAQNGKREATKLEWCGCWYCCVHSETNEDLGDKAIPTKSAPDTHSHSNERIVECIVDDPREDEINHNLK